MNENALPVGENLAEQVDHYFGRSMDVLTDIYHQLPTLVVRLIMAGIAIVAGMLLLRLMRKLINRKSTKKGNKANHTIKQAETVRSLTNSVVSYLMYFFMALVVLRIFGIDLTSLLAVAGIGSIAIGFGAQTLVKDIISGLFLWTEGNLNVGDVVTIAGYNGRIESLSLRTTTLRGTDGSLYAVPNGDIRTV
ncbi:MAG: mechanosensitive ion channel, partial [Clostridia bacterium]|nr:mechanosensitive ion channel [Clostridia bacterium]